MPDTLAARSAATEVASHVAKVWIDIRRGRTQYPRRPIDGDRFLIGAGSSCQLQLGGEMPLVHSLIVRDAEAIVIEALAPRPELHVNGQPVRTTVLADGDSIGIGPFEFTLHAETGELHEPADSLLDPVPEELRDAPPEEIAAMSAAELVARIESAEQEIESYVAARQRGAERLLEAVMSAAQPSHEQRSAVSPEEQRLVGELTTISLDVEQRLARLRQREQEQAARGEALLLAQDRLAEQLRLAAQSLADEQARVRASA